VEPARGAERSARPGQSGQPGSLLRGWQSVAAGRGYVYRVASGLSSGKFEVFEPYAIRGRTSTTSFPIRGTTLLPRLRAADVGRIDAKTGTITIFKTRLPVPDRVADDGCTRSACGSVRTTAIGSACSIRVRKRFGMAGADARNLAYDVTSDQGWERVERRRVKRSDSAPRPEDRPVHRVPSSAATNLRRVFVDDRTTPPTFWVGNNHGASIVSWSRSTDNVLSSFSCLEEREPFRRAAPARLKASPSSDQGPVRGSGTAERALEHQRTAGVT